MYHTSFLFMTNTVPSCMRRTWSPLTCWWTFGSFVPFVCCPTMWPFRIVLLWACVHMCLSECLYSVLLGVYLAVEWLGRFYISPFKEQPKCPTAAAQFCLFSSQVQGSRFSASLPTFGFLLLDCSRPSGWEVVCHHAFVCHFPNDWWCWPSHVLVSYL